MLRGTGDVRVQFIEQSGAAYLADTDIDAVGTAQDVDLDVEVELTHALDQGFARILVGRDLE